MFWFCLLCCAFLLGGNTLYAQSDQPTLQQQGKAQGTVQDMVRYNARQATMQAQSPAFRSPAFATGEEFGKSSLYDNTWLLLSDGKSAPFTLSAPNTSGLSSATLCCSRAYPSDTELRKVQQAIASAARLKRPYNTLAYSLHLDWTEPLLAREETGNARRWSATNTMVIHVDSASMPTFSLHALTLRIDSAFVQRGDARPRSMTSSFPAVPRERITSITYSAATEEVHLALPASLQARQGDTLTFVLHYTHISTANASSGGGFLLYNKGRFGGLVLNRTDSIFTAERLAYTMSQPNDARRWLPCNDVPSDKAFADIAVTVPAGYTAVSNGLLARTKGHRRLQGDSVITYFWQHHYPIPPYLMVVAASVYQKKAAWYKRLSNPHDSIEVPTYYWAVDDTTSRTDGTRLNVSYTVSDKVRTIEAFSRWYGEYPFEKFGTAVIQPFWAGGMEHQTLQTINRSWLRGIQWGVAHEIVHHWLGNKVTCSSWSDIWLNEGGATHGEALWYESWGGEAYYRSAMDNFRTGYLRGMNTNPLYVAGADTASVPVLFNYATTYAKAAWVYHMIRQMVGDSAFFHAMRHHLERFAYSTASTDDFRISLETIIPTPPVPWKVFFQQWVYQARHPLYDMAWTILNAAGGTNIQHSPLQETRVSVRIAQLQSGTNVPDVFFMPLSLTFIGRSGERFVERILNNQRTQSFVVRVPFHPIQVLLDERGDVLCERTNRAAHRQRADTTAKTIQARVYPTPLPPGEPLTVEITTPQDNNMPRRIRIELLDLLGRVVATIYDGQNASTPARTHYYHAVQTAHLPQGTYFARLYIQPEHLPALPQSTMLSAPSSELLLLPFQIQR